MDSTPANQRLRKLKSWPSANAKQQRIGQDLHDELWQYLTVISSKAGC